MFIDTHCHLSKQDYRDINSVIENAKNNGVEELIICSCDKNSMEEAIEIANKNNNVYLEVGYHPSEANYVTEDDISYLNKIIKANKKVVAVGEIGLDYHWDKENKEAQKTLFKKMLEIAEKENLPVVIHSRDAFQDTYDILKASKIRKGDIHCFSGNSTNAKMYLELGFYLGIGGVLTFKNTNLVGVLKDIPLDRVLLETDSPYLSPDPFRGQKNEPKNIPIIAKKISEIKNIDIKEVENIIEKNTIELFFAAKH